MRVGNLVLCPHFSHQDRDVALGVTDSLSLRPRAQRCQLALHHRESFGIETLLRLLSDVLRVVHDMCGPELERG
jgi:hypothetical protein